MITLKLQKSRMPAQMILMPLGGEECKTTSALILIFSPVFQPKAMSPLPVSQEGGHSPESARVLWSPFAGRVMKILPPTPSEFCLHVYLRHW